MRKSWKFILAACIGCLLTVQSAQAEGGYVGIGMGLLQLDPGQNQKAAVGGNLYLGVELGQLLAIETRFGTTQAVTSKGETSKLDWFASAIAKPKYALAGNLNIYALVGLTMMKSSFTPAAGVEKSATTVSPTFGAGVEFYLSHNALVGAEWVRYASKADSGVKNTNYQGMDVDAMLVTVQLNF